MMEGYDIELKSLMHGVAVSAPPFKWASNENFGAEAKNALNTIGLDIREIGIKTETGEFIETEDGEIFYVEGGILSRRLFIYQSLLLSFGFKSDRMHSVDTTRLTIHDFPITNTNGLEDWEKGDLHTYISGLASALKSDSDVVKNLQSKGLLTGYHNASSDSERLANILYALI